MKLWRSYLSKNIGGCHCGAVKLETDLNPMIVNLCNCNRCRVLTGSIAIAALYSDEEINMAGETKTYNYLGGSGMEVVNHFCPNCGCRIVSFAEAFPGIGAYPIGIFEKSTEFIPKSEIFTNYKLPWLQNDGCIEESFEEAAVGERLMLLLEELENR